MGLDQFTRWKLEQELANDLRRAFQGSARLRAARAELLQKIATIDKKLARNAKKQKVLDDPKYSELEIRLDGEFLQSIEEQAAANAVLKNKSNVSLLEMAAKKGHNRRLTPDEKMDWLCEYLRNSNHKNLTVAEITKQLEKDGLVEGGSATQWLKPLKLPQKCFPWVQSGNRRMGKRFLWWHSTELRSRMEVFGIIPPTKK